MDNTISPSTERNLSKRRQWVLNGLEQRGADFTTATEYGEPGYSTDKPLIVFANWNHLNKDDKSSFTRRSTMDAIGALVEIEWCDEWTTCSETGKAYRTQGDSYQWQSSLVWLDDCTLVGIDYVLSDDSYLKDYLETLVNEPRKCVMSHVSESRLEALGCVKLEDDFENGWHPGQDARPEVILKAYLARNPEGRFIFRLDYSSQFSCGFAIWSFPEQD